MLFDYETLQVIWWLLIGILLVGFALTNGLDMAVSTLLFAVGKNAQERKVLISTIVPHWDGNQVWLITAGGAIFAAWPEVYAASFSGLYWAMILVLFAIWLRPLAFEYRNHADTDSWYKKWDITLVVGSFIPMLIFGVAFGNLLQGLPFHADENVRWHYEGYFLTALLPLLNPFAILCGLVSVVMLLLQGSLWIQLRTVDEIGSRAKRISLICGLLAVVLFLIAGAWSYTFDGWKLVATAPEGSFHIVTAKTVEIVPNGLFANYEAYPVTIAIPVFAVLFLLGAAVKGSKGQAGIGLFYSSLGICFVIFTAAAALFPFVMPSSKDMASSLTIWDVTSSHLTLSNMLIAVIIFLPISLIYTIWAYVRMWGKASVDNTVSYH